MPNCKFYGARRQATTNLFFSEKSTPGKFAYTCHFRQIGINAKKIEKTGIHFETDVFDAVAVVDAKAKAKDPTTRRQRERRLKSGFAFLQLLSQLLLPTYFVKCR